MSYTNDHLPDICPGVHCINFFPKSLMISGITLTCLYQFELFLHSVQDSNSFILLLVAVQCSQPHLFNIPCVYPRYIFLSLLPYINQLYMLSYIWAFYFLHWCMCFLLGKYYTVLITIGLQYSLNLGTMLYPGLFFLNISMTVWGHLFHKNVRNICPIYVKYATGNLTGVTFNL